MPAENKFDPEKLEIEEIKIIQGEINSPFKFRISNIEKFGVKIGLKVGNNARAKKVKTDLVVEVQSESKPGTTREEASGRFHFSFIFRVENFDELTRVRDDGMLGIQMDLLSAVATVSYSTARGILLTRFQGTSLQEFILPIINPEVLLKSAESNFVANKTIDGEEVDEDEDDDQSGN